MTNGSQVGLTPTSPTLGEGAKSVPLVQRNPILCRLLGALPSPPPGRCLRLSGLPARVGRVRVRDRVEVAKVRRRDRAVRGGRKGFVPENRPLANKPLLRCDVSCKIKHIDANSRKFAGSRLRKNGLHKAHFFLQKMLMGWARWQIFGPLLKRPRKTLDLN